ncbi:MAG TPA: TetR/AcrR family transcriptional regulator [Acidimicrobiales bacterium]|nr:TetR/AcrR family transcriptional regulator [Acidimicrobiales bacterium]
MSKVPVKRMSRAERQSLTREAILDAAVELFIQRGVEATSIDEVTAQAGYSRGAFYSNFDSKDDLFVGACARFLEQLHVTARPPDDENLSDAGRAYRSRMERLRSANRDRASMFLAEISLYAIRHPDLVPAIAELHQAQLEPAIAFVRSTLPRGGQHSEAEIEALANIMQSLTFALHLFGKIDPGIGPESAMELASGLIVDGLAARARKGRK